MNSCMWLLLFNMMLVRLIHPLSNVVGHLSLLYITTLSEYYHNQLCHFIADRYLGSLQFGLL